MCCFGDVKVIEIVTKPHQRYPGQFNRISNVRAPRVLRIVTTTLGVQVENRRYIKVCKLTECEVRDELCRPRGAHPRGTSHGQRAAPAIGILQYIYNSGS